MIWYRVLAAALLAVAVPACAGGGPASSGRKHVRTRGVIVTVGGPAPGSPRPIAGAEFTVHGAADGAIVRADAHGRFAFDVAPGTYRITVTGHAPMGGDAFLRPIPNVIHIGPHGSRIRLVVSIK